MALFGPVEPKYEEGGGSRKIWSLAQLFDYIQPDPGDDYFKFVVVNFINPRTVR